MDTGIDIAILKAHSTRSASSSKSDISGVAIEDILKRGNWSDEPTWQKFDKNVESQVIYEEALFRKCSETL